MKVISGGFVILLVMVGISGKNDEWRKELAWMEEAGGDKFFEYSDMISAVDDEITSSEVLMPRSAHKSKPNKSNQMVDVFLSKVWKMMDPPKRKHRRRQKNETNKGLDIHLQKLQKFQNPGINKSAAQINALYIGTNWCGTGNSARNNELGYFYKTDYCCRAHDTCPQSIQASETAFGLKNGGSFTRSHCDCDEQFYRCLKAAKTYVSQNVGLVYFNLLGPQCFREDHPMECDIKKGSRCVKYRKDSSKPKQFQWIDNRKF